MTYASSHIHSHGDGGFYFVQEFKIATFMDTDNVEEIQEFLEESIKGDLAVVSVVGSLDYSLSLSLLPLSCSLFPLLLSPPLLQVTVRV